MKGNFINNTERKHIVIKKDKEITDRNEIKEILKKAEIIRVAFCENSNPYIVPLIFGYKQESIYIHSSKKGMKIEILKKNNKVSFEVDIDTEVFESQKACSFSMRYKSIVGFGKAYFVSDLKGKKEALDIIMSHYSKSVFEYSQAELINICIIRIDIETMTGKKS